MSQLPPFRTRRSEPVLNLNDPPEPPTTMLPEEDDDVPVLTQVVTPPTPAAERSDAENPAPPSSFDAKAVDAIVADIMSELQPEIEERVRQVLLRHLA